MTTTALSLNKGVRVQVPTPQSLMTALVARLRAIGVWLSRAICGLSGHERFMHREEGRLCLRCWYCGDESAGWQTARAPRIRAMTPVVTRRQAA